MNMENGSNKKTVKSSFTTKKEEVRRACLTDYDDDYDDGDISWNEFERLSFETRKNEKKERWDRDE